MKQVARVDEVQLIWIQGHKGFEGNEKVDELAKKGAASTNVDIEAPVSIGLIKHQLRKWMFEKANSN